MTRHRRPCTCIAIKLGEAVETTAGDMPARYAIHAATMEPGGPTATATALVAFGTGVGRFPSEDAGRFPSEDAGRLMAEDAGRLMADVVRQHRAGSVEKVVCSPLQATQPNRALEASLESSARG